MSLVEKCWMVTSKISVLALLMITGIYFGKFVCPYIKKKKGAVAVSIVYITIMLVLYMIPPQIDNFSAYLIGVIAAFLAMYVEDRRNIYQKIFLAITFFSIRWLTVAMAARLDDLVTKALVFRNMSAEKVWLQYGLYVGTRVLDIVLCIAFIAVAIGLINKAYIYKKDEMSIKEMVMLIIPSLVGVTGYGILQYYLMIYERDTGKNLIDTYGFYGALSFLHYLISIVAILVVIVMFQNWKEMQEEQRGQELVLNQISDMKKHIEEVEKLYRDIRSMRHDMGYDGKLTDWIDLCGVYFRFPCDDFEDIYWDDDYKQGVSIKTWFRKKYTAPYSYGGKWEHYAFANATAKSLITENPVIRVTPSFDEWMEMKKNGIDVSKQKDKMIPVTDATIEQVGLGFESRMDELLERLKVTEVLAAKNEKVPDDIRAAVKFVAKRLAKVNEEIEVTPITKSLKYNYDYGDGWEVDIVMEEKYYTKNRLDTAFEGNVDGFVVVPNEEGLIEEARAYDMSDHLQDELLSKIIQTVEIKGKPICIFADGLPVMDDVGGVHGYIDFLMTSRLGNQEERDEIRDWASGMGWTGRMYKPENIL